MELLFFYCALLESWKTHANGRTGASECCWVQLIEFARFNICVLLSSAISRKAKLCFLIASSVCLRIVFIVSPCELPSGIHFSRQSMGIALPTRYEILPRPRSHQGLHHDAR